MTPCNGMCITLRAAVLPLSRSRQSTSRFGICAARQAGSPYGKSRQRAVADARVRVRPGGVLFIHEHHPVLLMMEPGPPEAPVNFELSYFDESPYVDASGLDYFGGETYDATPNNSFMHTMSDIIMAGLGAGLTLQHFEERPDHISNAWYNVEAAGVGMPMSYVLELRKA